MFKKLFMKEYTPKVGDFITVSKRNPNHLGTNITAYAGVSGNIARVWEDNSFYIFSGSSILVVPLNKREKFYVLLNGVEFYVKGK